MGNVYLQGSTDGSTWTMVWAKSGNVGNSWGYKYIGVGGSYTYLRFYYTGGSSWTGDFALDAITITYYEIKSVPCPTAYPTTEPTVRPTSRPTLRPTPQPTSLPSPQPTPLPTKQPSPLPTSQPRR